MNYLNKQHAKVAFAGCGWAACPSSSSRNRESAKLGWIQHHMTFFETLKDSINQTQKLRNHVHFRMAPNIFCSVAEGRRGLSRRA